MMPWLIPSSVRLNSSVTSCRARQCSTQAARLYLSFATDRFYPISRDWASEGLDFSSLGLGCEFVIDIAPMNSDVPGSVDADPHLIAANLSDDNLGHGNLDLKIY